MTIQTVNLGTAPTGAGGDTFRSTGAKMNENFTNPSHAASRMVGTAAGNVVEVGAFGLGSSVVSGLNVKSSSYMDNIDLAKSESFPYFNEAIPSTYGFLSRFAAGTHVENRWVVDLIYGTNNELYSRFSVNSSGFGGIKKILTTANTTVDANGFIKAASPIAKLFADKIEPNNEAADQNIVFQKIDVGHYLIQGSSGFALEGWYIETPKDANGNILFAVNYEQLENGDIEVKTYKKKFDLESASIVADLENPVDITLNRWIDIRLQEVPKPVPEMPTEEVNSDEPQQ
ncbi:hypothetical protein Q4108_02430 [Acinetobacter baumannii]